MPRVAGFLAGRSWAHSCAVRAVPLGPRIAICRSIFGMDPEPPSAPSVAAAGNTRARGARQRHPPPAGPQPRSGPDGAATGGRSGCAGQRTGEDAWSGVKAGQCDESALQVLAASRPYAPSGLLRCINLPPPCVMLLRDSDGKLFFGNN